MSRITDLQKNLFGGTTSNARQFGMISTLVAIVLLFQIWTHGLTLTSGNLVAVASQYSYILILAIGMLMVIVAGHIDLSVGSVAAFTGIVVAKTMQEYSLPGRSAFCSACSSARRSARGRASGSPTSASRPSS